MAAEALGSHEEETISFLVGLVDDEQSGNAGGTKGIFSQREAPALRQIPVTVLRENLHRTVKELGKLFRDLNNPSDGLSLREVEVSFEVTATGKIAVLGTSAEAAGKGAITLRFEGISSRE